MRERDGLRPLAMRVRGHHRTVMFLRTPHEGVLQVGRCPHQSQAGAQRVEAKVGGDLIVAAPSRVQPSRNRPGNLVQASLHRHVDVFVRSVEHEGIALEFAEDPHQSLLDCLMLLTVDQTGVAQHTRVRDRSGDILRIQPAIDVE